MTFTDLPQRAAWRHVEARDGFEVAFFTSRGDEHLAVGSTSALENGSAWAVRYEVWLDADWTTESATVHGLSTNGATAVTVERTAPGRWLVDGGPSRDLDGCLDVDLESSALTNAFPVHRLALGVGESAEAPAVYVRAGDLGVERLEQRYLRLPDGNGTRRYRYDSATFDFSAELVYDESGLVTSYPGLAVRLS